MFAPQPNVGAADCWRQVPLGLKCMLILLLSTSLLSLFTELFVYAFIFSTLKMVSFQVWRLLTSWWVLGSGISALINFLFNAYMLYSLLPPMEKKLSTTYTLTDIFIQALQINVIFTGLSLLYYLVSGNIEGIAYGTWPLIMVYIWHSIASDPDKEVSFCCLPMLVPQKWIPVIFLAFSFLMGGNVVPNAIGCLLGYLQYVRLGRNLIRIPLGYYRKIDSWLPLSITKREDFVRVSAVEKELEKMSGSCWSSAQSHTSNATNSRNRNQIRNQNNNFHNPFLEENNNQRVQVIGGGHVIGGTALEGNEKIDYKKFWAEHGDEMTNKVSNADRQTEEAMVQSFNETNLTETGLKNKELSQDEIFQSQKNDTNTDT